MHTANADIPCADTQSFGQLWRLPCAREGDLGVRHKALTIQLGKFYLSLPAVDASIIVQGTFRRCSVTAAAARATQGHTAFCSHRPDVE